jgi:hypothetical protein
LSAHRGISSLVSRLCICPDVSLYWRHASMCANCRSRSQLLILVCLLSSSTAHRTAPAESCLTTWLLAPVLPAGSDLVYNTAGAHALPKVLGRLMQPAPLQHQGRTAQQQALNSQAPAHAAGLSGEVQSEQPHGSEPVQQQQQQQLSQHGSDPQESCSSRMVVGPHCASPSRPVMYYAHTKHR